MFDLPRWRRDALTGAGVFLVVFAIGVVWIGNAGNLELGSLVAWGVFNLAAAAWIAACLRGSTGGFVGMIFLALLVASLVIGYSVQQITGSEAGLIGAVTLITFGVMVVPVTAFWSLIDLMRPAQLRRWQAKRYSTKDSTNGTSE